MPPAARVHDAHQCSHRGGPIAGGDASVLIGGHPAARIGDPALCQAPPDSVTGGEPSVRIGGRPAARLGDATAHGGMITGGESTVWIGRNQPVECLRRAARRGAPLVHGPRGRAGAQPTDAERLDAAISRIEASDFGATERGQRLTERLRTLHASGHLRFETPYDEQGNAVNAQWDGADLRVNPSYRDDPDGLASRLVHEGTHASAGHVRTTETERVTRQEMEAFTAQLDFYEEQRRAGAPHDVDMEAGRDLREAGGDEALEAHIRELYKRDDPPEAAP